MCQYLCGHRCTVIGCALSTSPSANQCCDSLNSTPSFNCSCPNSPVDIALAPRTAVHPQVIPSYQSFHLWSRRPADAAHIPLSLRRIRIRNLKPLIETILIFMGGTNILSVYRYIHQYCRSTPAVDQEKLAMFISMIRYPSVGAAEVDKRYLWFANVVYYSINRRIYPVFSRQISRCKAMGSIQCGCCRKLTL